MRPTQFEPQYGDRLDNEGHRIVTSLSTMPGFGDPATPIWVPGARYCTGMSIRLATLRVAEISRDGKGDKLYVDLVAARRAMAPVVLNEVDPTAADAVAWVGLDMHQQTFPVTEGRDWHAPDAKTVYKITEVQALAWLGARFII